MSWLQWLQMQPCIAKPPARAWKHDSFRQSGIWAVALMHFAYFALRTVIDVMVIESVLGWLTGRILRCWFLLAQGCWPHVLRQCCFLLHSLVAWRMLQSLPQLMTVVAMQSLNARRHADNMDSHLPKDLYVHYPHNSVVLCFIMFYWYWCWSLIHEPEFQCPNTSVAMPSCIWNTRMRWMPFSTRLVTQPLVGSCVTVTMARLGNLSWAWLSPSPSQHLGRTWDNIAGDRKKDYDDYDQKVQKHFDNIFSYTSVEYKRSHSDLFPK